MQTSETVENKIRNFSGCEKHAFQKKKKSVEGRGLLHGRLLNKLYSYNNQKCQLNFKKVWSFWIILRTDRMKASIPIRLIQEMALSFLPWATSGSG